MKTILMSLALGLITYAGAEAQICKCKTVAKHTTHHRVLHHTATQPAAVTTDESSTAILCKTVPYQACTINADHRSVTCYETKDLDNLTPLNTQVTTYGPTGPVPGQTEQPAMKTIVIKGQPVANLCKREDERKATVCTYNNGTRLYRDPWGYYYYR